MSGRVAKDSWDRIFMYSRRLWNEFDPIGVLELAGADDEYDFYAGEAALLATRFVAKDEYLAVTKAAVYQRMGLSLPVSQVEDFATHLHRELSQIALKIADQGELFDK